MTNDAQSPPFWPFVVVDVLFVGVAVALMEMGHRPLLWWEAAGLLVCAVAGSGAFLTPFLLHSAHSRTLAQAQKLADATAKIQRLDELASQISNSTVQWQAVQDGAAKTAQVAADLAQNMAAEARAFTEFLQKANDAEKAHLRLEADKLRRSEGEWVEIVVRMLDQVYALFQAAMQSGQPALAEQIGRFQNACRDISRRAGLTPVAPLAGESFDARRHQLMQDAAAPENAVIQETLAAGYTYQGQLIRRALVRLQEGENGNDKV
jgi:molecular chaperone GrpE (heat shock protein)